MTDPCTILIVAAFSTVILGCTAAVGFMFGVGYARRKL